MNKNILLSFLILFESGDSFHFVVNMGASNNHVVIVTQYQKFLYEEISGISKFISYGILFRCLKGGLLIFIPKIHSRHWSIPPKL